MTNYFQKSLFYPIIYAFCLVVIFHSEALSMLNEHEQDPLRDGSPGLKNKNMLTNESLKIPGEGNWKDLNGKSAHHDVRKAADELWTAVKEEEDAAWKDGWCFLEKGEWSCARITCCILTCYTKECCDVGMTSPKYDTFARHDWARDEITKIKYENAQRNTASTLKTFKETINNFVLKPVNYSGDVNICNIDGWVKDPDNFARNDLHFTYRYARRDTSTILKSTMAFVNSHGGWTEQPNPFSAVNARMVGDTIVMGGM